MYLQPDIGPSLSTQVLLIGWTLKAVRCENREICAKVAENGWFCESPLLCVGTPKLPFSRLPSHNLAKDRACKRIQSGGTSGRSEAGHSLIGETLL